MFELRDTYTIVIVTHNMQQASRVSDHTAFLTVGDDGAGYLVEFGDDDGHLHQPSRTADRRLRLGPVRLSRERESDMDNRTAAADGIEEPGRKFAGTSPEGQRHG